MIGRILTQDASASCLTVLDVTMLPKTGSAGQGSMTVRNARRETGRGAIAV